MYKADLPRKAGTVLEARKEQERQRQTRIFYPCYCRMGVDMEALQCQVAERKLQEETEKCREEAFDLVHLQGAQVAQILETKEQERAWGLCQALEATWVQQQTQDQAIELEDQGPPGPASLQCFKGEDPGVVVRRREQQNEQHRVLDQQREAQNRAQAERDYIEALKQQQQVVLGLRALELEELENVCRCARAQATATYNQAQAAEMAEQQRLAQAQEQSMVHAEMQAEPTGSLVPTGLLEPTQTLHQAQVTQHQECQEEEQRWEAEWAAQSQAAAREGLAMEKLESRTQKGLRQALDSFSRQLAEEQRAQQQHLNRDIYTNMPIAQYHLQFSTSSR